MLSRTPDRRVLLVALLVVVLDQSTKYLVVHFLGLDQQVVLVDGFLKLVHWGNTGAAWSLFPGSNTILAILAVVALIVLIFSLRGFDIRAVSSQLGWGLIFGGVTGNLIDRVTVHHVIDFIYFYLRHGDGRETGFPAFNVADSALSFGAGLILLVSWRKR